MKRIIIFSLCILLLLNLLSSCTKKDQYTVDYPEIYTPAYCRENYIEADPNLMHLRAADNDLGGIDVPGGGAKYCAIKDVPLDEYLLLDEYVLFAPLSYKIVKNKNNTNLPIQEVLSYKIKSVDIYSESNWHEDDVDKRKLGLDLVKEYIASVDGDSALAFQTHILECLETGNYRKAGAPGDIFEPVWQNTPVRLRVVFEDYQNIVWVTTIFKQNDVYYISFYTPGDSNEGGWIQNWLPLNQEITDLIKN